MKVKYKFHEDVSINRMIMRLERVDNINMNGKITDKIITLDLGNNDDIRIATMIVALNLADEIIEED